MPSPPWWTTKRTRSSTSFNSGTAATSRTREVANPASGRGAGRARPPRKAEVGQGTLVSVENADDGGGADTFEGRDGGAVGSTGGAGANTPTGAAGADSFRFTRSDSATDRVTALASDDQVELRGILTGFTAGREAEFLAVQGSGADLILAIDASGTTGAAACPDLVRLDGRAGAALAELVANRNILFA